MPTKAAEPLGLSELRGRGGQGGVMELEGRREPGGLGEPHEPLL